MLGCDSRTLDDGGVHVPLNKCLDKESSEDDDRLTQEVFHKVTDTDLVG